MHCIIQRGICNILPILASDWPVSPVRPEPKAAVKNQDMFRILLFRRATDHVEFQFLGHPDHFCKRGEEKKTKNRSLNMFIQQCVEDIIFPLGGVVHRVHKGRCSPFGLC